MVGWKLLLLNYAGSLYTIFVVFGMAALNIFFTCPKLNHTGCQTPTILAIFILFEVITNMLLFHLFMKKNQVQYWVTKSSNLLGISFKDESRNSLIVSEANNVVDEINEYFNDISAHETKKFETRSSLKNYEKLEFCGDGTYQVIYRDGVHLGDGGPTSIINKFAKYCHECKKVIPRRCHHCPLCKMCILRKDHHCFMLSGCAGLANHRYFILFLFWATIGASYGSYYTMLYLNKFVTPFWPFGWITYIGPIALVRWFFGYEMLGNAGLAIAFSISFASAFSAGAFFIFQIIYAIRGYTMHDFHATNPLKRGIDSDGEMVSERLALIFGRRWWLNFLIPHFWLPNEMSPAVARGIFLNVSKDL